MRTSPSSSNRPPAGTFKDNEPNKAMEDAVVKTVAGFLNTDGGTLLIGVGPDRRWSGWSTTIDV